MGYRILIAEDEDLIRRGIVYSTDWNELNCTQVDEASDGQQALDMILREDYHIVLMDINMPMLDGLSVLAQTCEIRDYVPILLTGYAEFSYAQRAISYRVNSYLLKPVSFKLLHNHILRAQEEWERRRAADKEQNTDFPIPNLLPEIGSGHSEPVQKILEYVQANYARRLTITDMAKQLHYSETFLIRAFGREMDMKFTDFLNRYRIRKAIPLVLSPGSQTADVAVACGFSDQKYFNAVFKRYMGCSVREFRERIRSQL